MKDDRRSSWVQRSWGGSVRPWLLLCVLIVAGCDMRKPEPPPAEPALPARPSISLFEAARPGDIEQIDLHLYWESDVNQTGTDGMTPLHAASLMGHVEVVELLVEYGAHVNTTDRFGSTPLHAAVGEGRLDIVQRLVLRGADLNARDSSGYASAQIADLLGHKDIVDFLVSMGAEGIEKEVEEAFVEIEEVEAPAPVETVYITEGEFRTWTSASGQQVEAEFMELALDTVVLRTRDDQRIRVHITHLHRDDQIQARSLAAAARPPMPARPGVAARPERRVDSIGMQVAREKGWELLENCRLTRNASNDGDSFHVRHGNKEYIFRTYYVDAAETDLRFPDRVNEQAKYFGTSVRDTLKLGELATDYTKRALDGQMFNVVTRWQDARGSSRQPRYFAFIITDKGDLDELLVEQGLVRIYGMPVDGQNGLRKLRRLKQLEKDAKQQQAGAWGMKQAATAGK